MIQHKEKKLPNTPGVSLKAQHYQTIIDTKPNIDWFECHPENYMGDGGLPHYFLKKISEHYPISMHGVGMSLGSSSGVDQNQLELLSKVITTFQPTQISEHLAWSHHNNTYLNDLLPLPYTKDFLAIVTNNVLKVQDKLKQSILIENPSIYIGHNNNELNETDFLYELVKKTDCGLLLDVNNVFISATNMHFSAEDYINNYPLEYVGEIHLAGHAKNSLNQKTILIDDHGSPVSKDVWNLFEYTMKKSNKNLPVLIEWDTNIPDLSVLLDEASIASKIMKQRDTMQKVTTL